MIHRLAAPIQFVIVFLTLLPLSASRSLAAEPELNVHAAALPSGVDAGSQHSHMALMRIRFVQQMPVEAALEVIAATGARPSMLEYQHSIDEQIFTGGLALRSASNAAAISSTLRRAQLDYVRDAMASLQADDLPSAETKLLIEALEALTARVLSEPVTVIGALVESSELVEQRLAARPELWSVEPADPDSACKSSVGRSVASQPRAIDLGSEKVQGLDQSAWWANSGSITTDQCPSWDCIEVYRYVYQRFKWTSSRRLVTLKELEGGCPAYEQDAVYYNYDNKHYLGSEIEFWSSNYDHAYLDTQALDDGDEPVYTVGFHDVSDLQTDKNYTTYIRTNLGN